MLVEHLLKSIDLLQLDCDEDWRQVLEPVSGIKVDFGATLDEFKSLVVVSGNYCC